MLKTVSIYPLRYSGWENLNFLPKLFVTSTSDSDVSGEVSKKRIERKEKTEIECNRKIISRKSLCLIKCKYKRKHNETEDNKYLNP